MFHLINQWKVQIVFFILLFYSCAEDKPNSISNSQFSGLSFGTDDTFEVLTWNLETFPKAEDNTVEYVAQILVELDCDIAGLQEINSGSYFTALVNRCNQLDGENDWVGVKTLGGSYGLAYIYKSNTIDFTDVFEIYHDENSAFPREPFIFKGDFNENSIILINNHLKCCGNDEIDSIDIDMDGIMDIPDDDDEEARRQAASLLLEDYVLNNFWDSNTIILGDFNDDIHEPEVSNVFSNFIKNSSNFKFIDMELAISGKNGQHWAHWSYPTWPSHIDHILITNNLFDEFEGNASTVTTIRIEDYFPNGWTDYDALVSDHRPVVWKFSF